MSSSHPPALKTAAHLKVAAIAEFEAASPESGDTLAEHLMPSLAEKSTSEDPEATPWYGLKQVPLSVVGQTEESVLGGGGGKYCVVDFSAMNTEEGDKAVALQENSDLFAAGYQGGFVNNLKTYKVVGASHFSDAALDSRFLVYTPITAGEGHGEQLMSVLQQSQDAAKERELQTSFFAIMQRQDDFNSFAYIGMFNSVEAANAHYGEGGVVTSVMQEALERNPALIAGEGSYADRVLNKDVRMYGFINKSRVDAYAASGVTPDDIEAWKVERQAFLEAQDDAQAAAQAQETAAREAAEKEARRKLFLEEAAKKSKNQDKNSSAILIQKHTRGYLTRLRVFRTVLENERARWESSVEVQVVQERKRAAALEKDRLHVEWYWGNYLNEIDQLKRLKEAEIKRSVQTINQKTRIQTRELMRVEEKRREEMIRGETTKFMESVYEFEGVANEVKELEAHRMRNGLTINGTRQNRGDAMLMKSRGLTQTTRKSALDYLDLPDEPSGFAERSRAIQSKVQSKRTGRADNYRRAESPFNLNKVKFSATNGDERDEFSSASTNKLDRTQLFGLARSRYGNGMDEE